VFTVIVRGTIATGGGVLEPRLLLASLLVGMIAFVITGVDLPEANRRFSRLAAADALPRLLDPPAAGHAAVDAPAVAGVHGALPAPVAAAGAKRS
jgi:hypothetical protein